MPKSNFSQGKVRVTIDENNPKDMKQKQKKSKEYRTMSKPDLVKLVEILISDDEQ